MRLSCANVPWLPTASLSSFTGLLVYDRPPFCMGLRGNLDFGQMAKRRCYRVVAICCRRPLECPVGSLVLGSVRRRQYRTKVLDSLRIPHLRSSWPQIIIAVFGPSVVASSAPPPPLRRSYYLLGAFNLVFPLFMRLPHWLLNVGRASGVAQSVFWGGFGFLVCLWLRRSDWPAPFYVIPITSIVRVKGGFWHLLGVGGGFRRDWPLDWAYPILGTVTPAWMITTISC